MNHAVAGIDVGSQSTKVVILDDERILATVTLKTGESAEAEVRQAMDEALRQAQVTLDELQNVVSTGAGRMSAPFARTQRSTATCLARGARFLFPRARTVVDAGAESSTAIRLSADGAVEDSVTNDRCAGGSGTFLDNMSQMLRIPLGELGAESLKATHAEQIVNKCAVFAESEVISLVHRVPPVPVADIVAGIHESMVDRLFALAQRVGAQHDLVMSGGVAKDVGVVRAMEARLRTGVSVPDDPQLVAALGAALIAQQDLDPTERMEARNSDAAESNAITKESANEHVE
jgi:predicted CoA-substrate-specific enzyme activase